MMENTFWVLVELEQGQPARSSLEVLGKAARLGRAEAIVLGSAAVEVAHTLGAYGADKVYVHEDATYDEYLTLPAVHTISELLKRQQPRLLMFAYTFELRDIAARLNVRHNMGLITDAADLHFEDDTLKVTVPWGGENVVTATLPNAGPGIVLTLPKAFAVEHHEGKTADIEMLTIALGTEAQLMKVVDRVELPREGPSIEDASVIVGGGRGLGKAENFHLVQELAAALEGASGATRAIVDAGWVPYSYQIGQTGKTVKPDLYIACGISGAIQHISGMKGAKYIVAINKDEQAPIFAIADLGVVGDVLTILPQLTQEVKQCKSQ
jgi:electron transfer flavoprotein alpha subunit